MTDPVSLSSRNDLHPATRPREFGPRDLWGMLRRNLLFITGTAAVVVAAAFVALFFLRPTYEGEATIILADSRQVPSLVREIAVFGGLGGLAGGGGGMGTDLAVLRSRHIAESVVDSLALHVELIKPQLPRSAVFRRISAAPDARAGTYELARQPDGSFRVTGPGSGGMPSLYATAGAPFQHDGLSFEIAPELASRNVDHLTLRVSPHSASVASLQETLSINRLDRESQVLSIQMRHSDPEMAAAIPNAVAGIFMDYKAQASRSNTGSYADFLREQAARYGEELAEAEVRLQRFREQAQVISPEHQAAEEVRRYADIKSRQEELRGQRESLSLLMNRVSGGAQGGSTQNRYRDIAAYPAFLVTPSIQAILQSLIELENERASLLVRRTESSIDVRGIDQRIGELEGNLLQTARSYLDGVNSELGIVDATVSRFAAELGTVPATELEFMRLSRQQKLLEQIYLLVQTNLKETEMQGASEPDGIRVLDFALAPREPVFPRPRLSLALALVFGLMLGTGGAVARELMNPRVRSRSDLEGMDDSPPLLGVIPRFGSRPNAMLRRVPALRIRSAEATIDPLVMRSTPSSSPAEAYRGLRTALARAGAGRATRVVVTTSSLPNEGKSACVANLALAFAQHDRSTLIIDADLRKPSLHLMFHADPRPGLTDVLQRGFAWRDAVQEVDSGGGMQPLHLLSAGSPAGSPAELLGSARMEALLDELRGHYDVILFDTPPLNAAVDGAVIGALAEHTLLVARAGVTEPEAIRNSVGTLARLGVSVAGVVLNDADPSDSEYAIVGEYRRLPTDLRLPTHQPSS